MKRNRILSCAVLALTLAVAGCMQPMTPELAGPGILLVAPGEGTVTATMRLSVADAAGRQLLAVVEPWKKVDIHHVALSLYDGAGTLLTSTTVPQASLGGTVTFSNLHANTSYKVVAEAWSDVDGLSPIHAGGEACTTTFATTNNDTIDAGAIKLALKNKLFSGATTGSTIQVTDGALESVPATESVTVVAPGPTITSVSPNAGATWGGNDVVITGTNFAGATQVTFGGTPATSFTVTSSTEIFCTAPAGPAGSVDVAVTTAAGTATSAGAYVYITSPGI